MAAPISGVAPRGVKAGGEGVRPDTAVRTPNPTRDGPEWGRFGEFCVPPPWEARLCLTPGQAVSISRRSR